VGVGVERVPLGFIFVWVVVREGKEEDGEEVVEVEGEKGWRRDWRSAAIS